MSGRRHPPHRQPRELRATLNAAEPGPPCGDDQRLHDLKCCRCWHLYDECPCDREDHMDAHLAADCGCTVAGAAP